MTQEAQAAVPVTSIDKAGKFAGRTVKLQGWLYNMREAGKLVVSDFSRRHGRDSGRGVAEGTAGGV